LEVSGYSDDENDPGIELEVWDMPLDIGTHREVEKFQINC
jgi:hypothetical protein